MIKNGDHCIMIGGAAIKVRGDIKAGDYVVPVRTADGRLVAVAMDAMRQAGEVGIIVTAADGVRVGLTERRGGVYAAGNSTVRRFTSDGVPTGAFAVWTTRVRDVAADSDGNVYIAGLRTSGQSVGKYSAAGSSVWGYDTGSAANAIAVDANRNVYIGADVRVIKLNANGSFAWQYQFNDPTQGGVVRSVSVDADGYVYSAIYHGTTIPPLRSRAVKLDSSGVLVWSYNSDIGNSASTICHDGSGGAYLGVVQDLALSFHDLHHIDATGAQVWKISRYPGVTNAGPLALHLAPSGDVYVGETTFGAGGAAHDGVERRARADGSLIWRAAATPGGSVIVRLSSKADGHVFVAGGQVTPSDQGWLSKVSDGGTLLWKTADLVPPVSDVVCCAEIG